MNPFLFLVPQRTILESTSLDYWARPSLVAIAVILCAVGLPAEGIGALLVLDRLLDMARTAINVFADAACTVIVARLEGETAVLNDQREPGSRPSLYRVSEERLRSEISDVIDVGDRTGFFDSLAGVAPDQIADQIRHRPRTANVGCDSEPLAIGDVAGYQVRAPGRTVV
jgi:hypothetical protein